MGGVDDGRALAVQPLDALENLVAALRIDGDGRLVKNNQLRLVGNAAGNVQAAQQAARKLFRVEFPKISETDEVDGLLHKLPAPRFVRDVEAAEIVDIFLHRQLVEDGNILHDDADAALYVVGIRRHGAAEYLHFAFVVPQQREDAVDGRRFSRTVWPEQAENFSFPNLQR